MRRLIHGGINQAGVPMSFGPDWLDTRGFMTRAVVLKTYYADDSEWKDRAWAGDGSVRGVCCDVRTYGRFSRMLYKAPVLQRAHGLHDEDVYVPRGATQDISGSGSLVTLPSGEEGGGSPTAAENLDGDHVMVGFLEGNPDAPVIFPYCLPHPSSSRRLTQDAGRVKRFRHAGVSIEWGEDGNLTLDASGAAKESLGPKGAEQSNSGTGGQITLRTSDGSNQTSIHLDEQAAIRLGSDPAAPADEPVVLGNLWIEIMDELLDALVAMTVGTGVGPSTTPINFAAFELVRAKIVTQRLHVSDFIYAKKAH
ncbi:MAG: hypothetical protein KJN79_09300 [Gammaproteobacteria bacterium]|nr:hypothetical protein [Gammaproteobacteria bacterium]